MRITIVRAAALAMVLACCAPAAARGEQAHNASVRHPIPDLAYALHDKLWLRSLHGGGAWSVPTPFPVSGIDWSPDGRAIAFQGMNSKGVSGVGVAVLQGHTWRTVFAQQPRIFLYSELGWSPDSRYLTLGAIAKYGSPVDLWLWDRTVQRSRLLLRGISPQFESVFWAHDSSRIAVAVGLGFPPWETKDTLTAEILNVKSGRVTRLGIGAPSAWSPDDRFVGFDHWGACGATGCFGQEDIVPLSGGRPIVLHSYVRGDWLSNEEWVQRRDGYAYDRWVISRSGHVLRRLVPQIEGRLNRVESWSPDGRWVAAKWLTSSYRIVLTLTNADTGRFRTLYVSGVTGGCEACDNAGYAVAWNHTSTAFALATPDLSGAILTEDRNPLFYIYALGSSTSPARLTKIAPRPGPNGVLLAWIDHDRAVMVYSGHTLYRYVPGRRGLDPIVRGLPDSFNYYRDYGFGVPLALRPSA